MLGLYRTIGERLKHQFLDNDAWVLSYREECFDQIGLKPSIKIPLYNGSLECEFRKYQIFSGKYKELRAEGKEIKTDEERRQMAEKRRFKMHREFKRAIDDDEEDFTPRRRDYDDRNGRPRGGHSFDRRTREDREDRGGSYEKRPFKREGKPFERRERSFDRKNKPFDRERKPFDRERKPFGKNRKFDRYDEED